VRRCDIDPLFSLTKQPNGGIVVSEARNRLPQGSEGTDMLSDKIEQAQEALVAYQRALSEARSYAVGDTTTYAILDQLTEELYGKQRTLHRLANEVSA